MLDIRSVVLDIRSVVFFSISCKRDFFDQLCLIFDQLTFFSISCKRDFFDQLCLIFDQLSFFRSVVLSVTFSISCA